MSPRLTPLRHHRAPDHPLPDTPAAIEAERLACMALLRSRAAASALASAVPLPGLASAADLALLLEILPHISARFGLDHKRVDRFDPAQRSILRTVLETLGPTLIGQAITRPLLLAMLRRAGLRVTARQLARFAPVIGTLGAASLGYTTFMRMGTRHIEHCVALRQALLHETAKGPGN